MSDRMKLLIIEDNEPFLKALHFLFKKDDVDIFLARDGAEGLKQIEKEKPDVILSDIMMPNLSGEELCERVKTHPKYSDCYFIMLTAVSDTKRIVKGLTHGADEYIVKPCSNQEIRARVRAALRKVRDRQESMKEYGIDAIHQLAVTASHEINTPLQTIISTAEFLLLSNKEASLETREHLRSIIENAVKIHLVTQKIGEINKLSSVEYSEGGPLMIDLDKSRTPEK
ncbi:MAG: response regulator [Fidelibacterota bacterium]